MRLTILLLLISLPLITFSQQEENNAALANKEIYVSLAASNTLSSDVAVHTLKLNKQAAGQADVDMVPSGTNSSEVQNIISIVSNYEGVKDCSFDRATQTFTVVTKPTVEIDPIITLINENHQ